MHNTSDAGRAVTIMGASLFLVAAAALSFSLYGGNPSTAKTVVLMVFAILSAFVLFIGQYLASVNGRRRKENRTVSRLPLPGFSADTKHEVKE